MLQNIRDKFTGGFALAILALIAIPFVFVGVGMNYSFISGTNIATVNGSDVPAAYFETRYRDVLARNPQLVDVSEELRAQIRRQLLDAVIREVAIDDYLATLGYNVGDDRVRRSIREIPQFQADGEFDMDLYLSVIGQQGYSPAQFEEVQRRVIREEQMSLAIGASAIVTPAEYRRYINVIAEQRVVTTAKLLPELVTDGIEISDEEIVEFYDTNTTLYQLPESVDIEYVRVSRDAVAAGVEVTEQELRDYYAQESSRYLQDEQRQARHILILNDEDEAAAREKAEGLLARVRAGEPFEDLAKQYSDDGGTASQGGDLGVLTRTQLPGDLGAAIFSMEEGEVRGLVETEFGFHIVRLDRVLEQGPLPFEQVRGELLTELQDERAEDAFLAAETAMSDALFDTPEMSAIAAAAGVDVQTLDGFTRNGGGVFGANQAAIDAVFDPRVLEDGAISDVIELDADASAVFRVTQYNPASRQPLDAVREQIREALVARRAEQLLAERADSIIAAVKSGEDFGAAAEAQGAVVADAQMIDRNNRELDLQVVVAAFTAEKPSADEPVVERVRNSEGGYTVFSLDAVLPGRPESIPVEDRDTRKLQLAQQSGMGDYTAFVDALVENAKIEIDEDLLAGDQLFQ